VRGDRDARGRQDSAGVPSRAHRPLRSSRGPAAELGFLPLALALAQAAAVIAAQHLGYSAYLTRLRAAIGHESAAPFV
jgi:hypothetical protein